MRMRMRINLLHCDKTPAHNGVLSFHAASTRSTMRAQWSSLLVILAVATHLVDASHFRGGTIQWRPVNANPGSFDGRVCALAS